MQKAIIALIVIVILGLGGWIYYMDSAPFEMAGLMPETNEPAAPAENTGAQPGGEQAATGTPVSAYTVRYTAEGFSPATLTVPLGTTVTFIDQSGRGMWVGSDEHPSHTDYSGTSRQEHCAGGTPSATAFDQCAVSPTYSFTFAKAGAWGYHNHVQAQHTGTIVVQ